MRRGSIALAWLFCMIPLTYALTQTLQVLFYPAPDPRVVLPSARIPMFWRVEVGAFVGVVVGLVTHALQARWSAGVERALSVAVAVTFVVVVVQASFFP